MYTLSAANLPVIKAKIKPKLKKVLNHLQKADSEAKGLCAECSSGAWKSTRPQFPLGADE